MSEYETFEADTEETSTSKSCIPSVKNLLPSSMVKRYAYSKLAGDSFYFSTADQQDDSTWETFVIGPIKAMIYGFIAGFMVITLYFIMAPKELWHTIPIFTMFYFIGFLTVLLIGYVVCGLAYLVEKWNRRKTMAMNEQEAGYNA